MGFSKSKKIITFGHKKVESMHIQSLQESVKLQELEKISKEDLILNLKYFQNCLINEGNPQNENKFHSSRGLMKNVTHVNFMNKIDFSKQKKLKKSFHRSKSQQIDTKEENEVKFLIDSHANQEPDNAEVQDQNKEPSQFVPEGMDINNFISILQKDEIKIISTKNMLDEKELEKINEIMMIHSEDNKNKISKKRKTIAKRQPKPSIDKNIKPEQPQTQILKETPKKDKIDYLKESFKLINSDQMKEDIQNIKPDVEPTSIKNSRLQLDFSDIEELDDTLINPLDEILNQQYSVKSEEFCDDLVKEEQDIQDKKSDDENPLYSPDESKSEQSKSDSMSEDEEMDFNNPDFKFVDFLEAKTKKLYTKREIKANISWSSTEYDIYNPEFTDDEKSVKIEKSVLSDQFYLESEDENCSSPKKSVENHSSKKKMKKFKVVLDKSDYLKDSQTIEENNSIIEITDCSKGIQISLSSSSEKENSHESYVKIASQQSAEDQNLNENLQLMKTQDFRDLILQNEKGHTRNNKHFISLKKIKEKGKVGIEKKWGQFLTRKVKERMKRDSDISAKEQGYSRLPYTNRSKKSKNPLNASLNITNQNKLLPNQKINYSFHSRYKDEINSVKGTKQTNKYNRSKNNSLIRVSQGNKKRHKSRKSSHCLKTGLFGFINNADNIYSVQNRRITIDSVDSGKNKSFFPNENIQKYTEKQLQNMNQAQFHVNSTLGRTTSNHVNFINS
jgi:hypothetical protein